MKIRIEDILPEEDDEVVIRCHSVSPELMKLIQHIKQGSSKMNLHRDGKVFLIHPDEIYYFESVDQKV